VKLSVALATWRGTAYLQAQLDSLVAQSRKPDELVAVDDASGDATPDVLEAFAAHAPFPVRVLRNASNLGYAANFNRALMECTGDLVLPCDQDDLWFPDKLAKFEAWASETPDAQIFACDAELTDGALNRSGRTKRGQIAAMGLPPEAFVMGCCLGVRRAFLDIALPIPDRARAHDTWLVELAGRFGLVDRRADVLQYYRQHGANTSDFAANTTLNIGFSHLAARQATSIWRRMRSDGGLCAELIFLTLQEERVVRASVGLQALCGPKRYDAALAALAARRETLEARTDVRSKRGLRRILAALLLWRGGGYSRSGGLRGVLRDLTVQGSAS
jgi:glycosyltransferase involved in cell wall biosynthesis